jgi:hypothetical protein
MYKLNFQNAKFYTTFYSNANETQTNRLCNRAALKWTIFFTCRFAFYAVIVACVCLSWDL